MDMEGRLSQAGVTGVRFRSYFDPSQPEISFVSRSGSSQGFGTSLIFYPAQDTVQLHVSIAGNLALVKYKTTEEVMQVLQDLKNQSLSVSVGQVLRKRKMRGTTSKTQAWRRTTFLFTR
jgi:hypothetical protein